VLTEITLPVSVKLTGIWQWFDSLHHIKGGYFIFYGFYHFWQSLVIAAILGFLFYVLLRELQKRQDTLFDQGEICLMLFAWFWLGWPRLVFLLSGGLLLAAILAIIKQLSHATEESRRISLGTAFIILAPALMIIGHRLLGLFGLNGLKI
jgi:prepilin signal peptidase PulO-like enzyme (type II secretory pathway)